MSPRVTVSCVGTVPCPVTVPRVATVPTRDTVASHATVSSQGPVLTGDFIVIFAIPQAGILGGREA